MRDAVVVGRANAGKSLLVVNLAAHCGQHSFLASVAAADDPAPPARWSVARARRGWVSAGAHDTLAVRSVVVPLRARGHPLAVRLWDTPGMVDGVAERPEVRHAIAAALEHAKAQGCLLLRAPVPAVAFAGRPIAWLMAPTRQLIELVEEPRRTHGG